MIITGVPLGYVAHAASKRMARLQKEIEREAEVRRRNGAINPLAALIAFDFLTGADFDGPFAEDDRSLADGDRFSMDDSRPYMDEDYGDSRWEDQYYSQDE
jgi:hypothetical protein